jgi:hypothetical protein
VPAVVKSFVFLREIGMPKKQSEITTVSTLRKSYVAPQLQHHANWNQLTLAGSGFVIPIGLLIQDNTDVGESA